VSICSPDDDDDSCGCTEEEVKEAKPKEVLVQEQLLLTLESAYPNILPVDDLAQYVTSINACRTVLTLHARPSYLTLPSVWVGISHPALRP